jgi:hypothetical protein
MAACVAAALLTATAAAPVGAQTAQTAQQDDLATKIANDYGNPVVKGAKGKLLDDPRVQGGKALRVAVARKGANNWDSVVETEVNKPIRAGDNLVLAFYARLEAGEGGATTATLPYNALQLVAAPYTTLFSEPITVGPEWKMYQIKGKAASSYAPGTVKASIQLGNAKQTVDFGTIFVLDMGQ